MHLGTIPLLLVTLVLSTVSVRRQSPAPTRKFKHRGKIEAKYDKFKDQTTVTLQPYYIQGTDPTLDPSAGLEIYAAFIYPGQTLSKQPDTVLLGLISTSDKGYLYE